MAYTTPRTWVTDETITATLLNTHVRDNVAWLATDAPCCRVYNSTNISITTSGAAQALTFDSERFDVGGMHSTSVNTGRITIPTGGGGKYLIGCALSFASNSTGYRYVSLRVNGTTTIGYDEKQAVNGSTTSFMVSGFYSLAAGDYVEVVVFQNSGAALNVTAASAYSPEFWAEWVRT